MPAGAHLADRIHRLAVLRHIHALGHLLQRPKLIRIHHEFLERRHKAAFQPAAGMQHEVHAAQERRVERVRRLVRRLRIGKL